MTHEDNAELWIELAEKNTEKWGVQPPEDVVLAILEELAEVADEMLEHGDINTHRLNDTEGRMLSLLLEIRGKGFKARQNLESAYENKHGEPLPPEERPNVLDGIDDTPRVQSEVNDLAPLVFQLSQSLDEYYDD